MAFDANRLLITISLGRISFEYDLISSLPMDWVWPKINLLLIDENNVVSILLLELIPANKTVSKQMSVVGKIGISLGVLTGRMLFIKSRLMQEGKAEFRLYLNGNLATISGSEAITTIMWVAIDRFKF